MARLAGSLGCKARKLPIRYALDYGLFQDKLIGFAEVKCRTVGFEAIHRMGGYMLSLGKWMSARTLYEMTGAPFFLAVSTPDGTFAARFDEFPVFTVSLGGRTDRRDWQDMEPVVMIPVWHFKIEVP